MSKHPYNMHREQQVAHRRVAPLLKDHPSGAMEHSDSDAFSKVTSKSAAERHDDVVAGNRGVSRYAKGGRVKGQTNIAIVLPSGSNTPAGPTAGPAMPPPGAGPALPPPAMMGPPPGGPPGMPPGMPMKAGGGAISGIANKPDLQKWGRQAAKERGYARGGAATGVGREEKAARMKGK